MAAFYHGATARRAGLAASSDRGGHLTGRVMPVEKMSNLLIDFRLSIRSTMQASARNPERQAPAKAG